MTLALSADGLPTTTLHVTADEYGVAGFILEGLQPATAYVYRLDGSPETSGSFSTFGDGPFSFRLAFASCASTGSNSKVFDAIRETQPDLFVHMGDLHYENIEKNEIARFAAAYDKVLATPRQSALFRSTAMVYLWDDHDFGPNDSDRTSPSRTASQAAYRAFVPHYPLAGPESTIHQAFNIGRVRVLALDTRAARDPKSAVSPRTMLGADQLRWLEAQLEAARTAPLVLLVNSVPWITKANETTGEGWAPYAEEREHIANAIERADLTRRIIMLSGDAHQLALDDGTNSQYSTIPGASHMGFPVLHAAPLDRYNTQKGGPYSHGELRQNGQFGVLDIEDTGDVVHVSFQGHRESGQAPNMRMAWTCDSRGLVRSDVVRS